MSNVTDKKPRNTVQKNLILNCIKKQPGHFTADDLVESLKQTGTPVGKATVYRNLKSMEKSGVVRCYHLHGDSACYQYVDREHGCLDHYHLKCTSCGRLIHVDRSYVNVFRSQLLDTFGFDMNISKTVIYGLCAKCRGAV